MLAAALLLADSRTPLGGYAHSGGLEAADLHPSEVPAFIAARARTVAFTEAALAAASVGALSTADRLTLDDEAVARTPSHALRATATALGRAVLRTGAQLYPDDAALAAYRAESTTTPRPVAFGAVAAAAGLDPESAAAIVLHEDAATVAAAAVKLLPVDAGAAAAWVAAGARDRERLAREAAAADPLPSLSAPLVELRSVHHVSDTGRLFAS